MPQLSFFKKLFGRQEGGETLRFEELVFQIWRRPRHRGIKVTLKADGAARVTTSIGMPISHIEEFLQERRSWIRKVRDQFRDLREKFPAKKGRNGESYLFRGQRYVLSVEAATTKRPQFELRDDRLILRTPNVDNDSYNHAALMAYFKKIGVQHLKERVDFFSKKMGLFPKKLTFRCQKTRWGSCTARGTVSLNWKLVSAPPEVLDYVVVHELSHLKHLNHSQNFWSLVESAAPHHKTAQAWLRKHQVELDFSEL